MRNSNLQLCKVGEDDIYDSQLSVEGVIISGMIVAFIHSANVMLDDWWNDFIIIHLCWS